MVSSSALRATIYCQKDFPLEDQNNWWLTISDPNMLYWFESYSTLKEAHTVATRLMELITDIDMSYNKRDWL